MIYDLFLTHAWRYHDDWNRFVTLLDGVPSFEWRNFSLPWYDPAFDPRSPVGERMVMRSLESQIGPVHCVILLASVYETRSARHWLDIELGIARRHGKPVLAASSHGAANVSLDVARLADGVVSWDADAAIRTIQACVDMKAS
jgi:hypothetical protein